MNKYLVILVCVMCAVSTGWAKKKKSHKAVQEPEAVEQVEESAAEAPSEEPAAVETSEETAVEAPAVEAPAEEAAAEESAPAEEVAADATESEEVAEASEEAVEESEEVSEDDEDEAVTKSKKKKKKKSKKKKSKKKKKKKHSDDDEDSDEGAVGVKLGFHAGLGSNVLEIAHGANGSLSLGLGFAYFFTDKIAVVSGADLNIAVLQYKVGGYTYGFNYSTYSSYAIPYEYTVNNGVASIVVPVKVRFAFTDMFWAEAGSGLILSLYSYNMYSGDNKPADGGATSIGGDITNFTIGAGMKIGNGSLGLEIGYRSTLSLGLTYNSGF